MRMMDIVMGRTAEQGARQLLWAALGPDGKDGQQLRQDGDADRALRSRVIEYQAVDKTLHERVLCESCRVRWETRLGDIRIKQD